MADEQTPQSDLIDDAIRQAERQLEEKLQALRMSALGEPSPSDAPPAPDVAVLRPTGSASRVSEPALPAPASEASETGLSNTDAVDFPDSFPSAWQETGSDDVTFTPADGGATGPVGGDLYVPEQEHPLELDDEASEAELPMAPPTPLHETFSATVTDLTPVWEDEDDPQLDVAPTSRRTPRDESSRPEPVHASWTGSDRGRPEERPPSRTTSLPSEDEMQFWAHTRTALRNLQQVTDGLTTQVTGNVSTEVSRLLHEGLAPTDSAVRSMQHQLERGLPQLAEQVEQAIQQAIAAPSNGIRQVRDEIPAQLDRVARAQHETLREELERANAVMHGAVQQDITQLEQSIATNVTRMAQGTTDAVSRVERDVDVLGETVVRVERGVHAEFDRFEAQLRTAIERVEQNLREELVEPTQTIKKLDEEMPARFSRIERSLLDQLQGSQREMSTVLTSLVDADRAALDRLASIASTMDEDRARRAEDVDIVVDTVTRGWEGLAAAMASLYEQAEENSRRLAGIEHRLTQIRDLEGAVEQTLDRFQEHMRELKPSPIVVTVSHEEAEVRNTTRSGWVPDTTS
jgi:hypothetical protein